MPYINTISLEKIKRYINYEYEFCGYIFYDVNNPDELNIIKNNTGPNVKIERGSCTYKHGYRRCIWHTHPYISKSYPSPEDLLKVLKHPDNIKISILLQYIDKASTFNNYIDKIFLEYNTKKKKA